VIDPGPVAQGRTLTRLSQEHRGDYRRIYVSAPDELPVSSRQSWAQRRLALEHPDRYREIYEEEKAKLKASGCSMEVDSAVVGKSSGPGPYHAVYVGRAATVCGRIRFHTYPAGAEREVTCTYCVDELRGKRRRERGVDPQFSGDSAAAEERLRELAELQQRTVAARESALGALSKLRTPPGGTAERLAFSYVLSKALECGLTLRDIGTQLGLSGERVRQIAGERNPRTES